MKINFYDKIKKTKSINPNYDNHRIEVPFRMTISSGSGSGKTHALCNLIYQMGKTFHEIIICIPSADEPLYDLMRDKLKQVIIYEDSKIPPLSNYSIIKNNQMQRIDKLQRLIVFDDYMGHPKVNAEIKQYYLRGRKLGFSSIYISQNYFQIPRDIRLNSQYFIVGRNIQKRDIKNILSIFSIDMRLDKFTEIYNILTRDKLDTMLLDVINKTIARNIVEERYYFDTETQCNNSYEMIKSTL